MIIDTHAHLNFNAYKNDLDEVIKRTFAKDIWVINVGSKYETSKRAVEIAEKYEKGIFAAIGLHPIYSATEFVKIKTDPEEGDFVIKEENFDKEKYRKLAESDKVVAIRKIGLDYEENVKSRVEEIIGRGGWNSGNAMVFVLWDNGTSAGDDYYDDGDTSNTYLEVVTTTAIVADYKYTIFLNQLE